MIEGSPRGGLFLYARKLKCAVAQCGQKYLHGETSILCDNSKHMKRFPPTLRCAQGRSLLGPKRKPLSPSLYAKRRKSQMHCARELKCAIAQCGQKYLHGEISILCNYIRHMKRLPYTLRCAQGAALPVCLLGPVREPLSPSLYANRRKSQVPLRTEGGSLCKTSQKWWKRDNIADAMTGGTSSFCTGEKWRLYRPNSEAISSHSLSRRLRRA